MELKLGASIKRLRTEKSITQEELADYIGISYQAVSKWETNTTTPDINLLPKLAVFFGVTIDDLFSINTEDHFERIDHILYHENMTDENFVYAKHVLDILLGEDENNVEALKRYAQLYLCKNNRDNLAAGRFLEKAIGISPLDEDIYGRLRQVRGGDVYTNKSGNDWFIRVCEPYAKKYPSLEKLTCLLIEAYISNRYFDRALDAVTGLKKSDNFMADIFTGDIELAKGNVELACEIWNNALPKNDKTYYHTGERFNKICKYDEAIYCFEASFSTATYPKHLDSTYSLAFLYDKLGKYDKAIEMWERILNILSSDWNTTEGTQVDWPKNEIKKLKEKM